MQFRYVLIQKVVPVIKYTWLGNKRCYTDPTRQCYISNYIKWCNEYGCRCGCKNERRTEYSTVEVTTKQPRSEHPEYSFLSAIQSFWYEIAHRSINSLIGAAIYWFDNVASEKLDNNFLILQVDMKCSVENNYNIPHLQKTKDVEKKVWKYLLELTKMYTESSC